MMRTVTTMRNLTKVGNSYAIILDREFIKNILNGQLQANLTVDLVNQEAKIHPTTNITKKVEDTLQTSKSLSARISPELQEWTQQFLDENKDALKELANL